jgi:hypothetical protein
MTMQRVLWHPEISDGQRGGVPSKPRKRKGKILLVSAVGLLLVVGAAVALAPTLASGMIAPRVEAAVNQRIMGSIKVDQVRLGWTTPTSVGPVELRDPSGKAVARATVNTPTTLWRVVSERWWTARNLDVGVVEIGGSADVVRDAEGRTNLQRALEPRAPQPATSSGAGSAPGSSSGGGIQSVKADVRLTGLNVTYTDAAQGAASDMGLKDLKGGAMIDYATAGAGRLVSKVDLSGMPTGAAAAGTEPLLIKLDADVSNLSGSGPSWPLPDVKTLKADVKNAPLTLVDALADFQGELVRDVGPRADITLDAALTRQAANARAVLVSDGARADVDLRTVDGVLVAQGGGAGGGGGERGTSNTLTLRSTGFLEHAPGLRDALAKAARQVSLDKAPGVEIVIENLRLPLPGAGAAGAPGAGSPGLAGMDMRGHGLTMRVRVGEMAGRVALEAPAQGAAAAPARAFRVEPAEIVIAAPDLSRGVTISGGTRATIDNAPAGEVTFRAAADGLLDAGGRLRALGADKSAGLAGNIDAALNVRGMSTALLQPLATTANLPVDLPSDVGPSLDVNLAARADAGQAQPAAGAGALPPLDWTLSVQSRNVTIDGAGRYAGNVATVTGNGLNVRVGSATGIATRILGPEAAVTLGGPGELTLSVKELAAPVDKLNGAEALGAVKALIDLDISRLSVGTRQAEGAPPARPIDIAQLAASVRLDGVNPPAARVNGRMAHDNRPFDLVGSATIDGIRDGKVPAGEGMARLIALRPTADLEIRNLPRSVLDLLPATATYGSTPLSGADMPAQIARAVRESIGESASFKLTTAPAQGSQDVNIQLGTAAGGLAGTIAANITPAQATIRTLDVQAGMQPRVVNPVLAAAARAPEPGRAPAPPLELGEPFRLRLTSPEPVVVPFKPGTTSPDWARAGEARLTLAGDNDIVIGNVPAGTDPQSGQPRLTSLRVKGLGADVRAPLSALAGDEAAKAKRLTAAFRLGAERGDGAAIARVSGTASSTLTGAGLEANIALADLDTAVIENLIGRPALLSGALGDKAQANLKIQPQGGGVTSIAADLTAPRLSEARLAFTQDATAIRLTQPATITWRPDASFVNAYVLGAQPGQGQQGQAQPSGARLGESSPVTIRLSRLSIASGQTQNGQVTAGPLKPGVFEVDAAVEVPSLTLVTPGATPRQQRRPDGPLNEIGQAIGGLVRPNQPRPNQPQERPAAEPDITTSIEGLRLTAKQAPGAPELEAVIAMDKVNGQAASAQGRQSGARLRVANLADARGVVDARRAVVNLDANLVAFPSAVVDGLARQNGLLAELLGPTVDLTATGRNVSLVSGPNQPAGNIQATLVSPRARAQLQGDIASGAFVQTGPTTLTISEIRRELVDMLAGGLPVVDSIQKTAADQPATITAETLSLPVDGDLTKLNGQLSVDPGVAQFEIKSALGELIDLAGGNIKGRIGDRIQPFIVNMNRGVLTYDRFTVPVGSFTLDTRGTVDLVQRRIDVVTYTPLGSLTQKAIGRVNNDLTARLAGIDKLTQVPIVIRGPLDNPSYEPDFGLMLKETVSDPGKLIDAIGNILAPKKKDEPRK